MLAQLADGEIDLALGVFPDAPGDIKRETLFEEHFVSVADRRSLPPRGGLPLPQWLERPVLVAMRPDAENEIDAALKAQGLRRHVAPDAAALERVDGSAGRNRPDPDGCQPGSWRTSPRARP